MSLGIFGITILAFVINQGNPAPWLRWLSILMVAVAVLAYIIFLFFVGAPRTKESSRRELWYISAMIVIAILFYFLGMNLSL
ncbi:MAG: hypothetical protein CMC08_03015 [Flavobacteriaceae bacterium]|nr:hypothetical protein [Flavobacteriaceae bacterium]